MVVKAVAQAEDMTLVGAIDRSPEHQRYAGELAGLVMEVPLLTSWNQCWHLPPRKDSRVMVDFTLQYSMTIFELRSRGIRPWVKSNANL